MTVFDFTRNDKQVSFFHAVMSAIAGITDYRYFFFGGGVRGGKTSVCFVILYFLAVKFPGSRWHVIRDSFPNLEATAIPSFEKFFPDGCEMIERYNRSPSNYYVTFTNGSKIYFKSESITHDPQLAWLDGLETNGIFLEQIESLHVKTWEKSLERVGSWVLPNMPPGIILSTFNPTHTWIKQKIYEPYMAGNLKAPYYFQQSTAIDNPFVTDDQWKAWKTMDSLTYQQRVKGDWNAFAATNAFAYAFNETKHVRDDLKGNPEYEYVLSFDFNHSPLACTIWQHYDNKIRLLYELIGMQGLPEVCDQIKRLLGWDEQAESLHEVVLVTGDSSGWQKSAQADANRNAYEVIQAQLKLTKYQITSPRSNPNLFKSRELVNGILENYPDILIHKRCKNVIFDLQFVEADDKHSIIKDRNKAAGKADFLDSFRYYLNTFHQDFIRI